MQAHASQLAALLPPFACIQWRTEKSGHSATASRAQCAARLGHSAVVHLARARLKSAILVTDLIPGNSASYTNVRARHKENEVALASLERQLPLNLSVQVSTSRPG